MIGTAITTLLATAEERKKTFQKCFSIMMRRGASEVDLSRVSQSMGNLHVKSKLFRQQK